MKSELIKQALDDGEAACPCCDTVFRVYRRKLNKNMAGFVAGLWALTNDIGQEYHHRDAVKSILNFHLGNDYQMARHWGLIEPHTIAGHYRLSDSGKLFANGEVLMREYALVLDNERIAFDGLDISINDALDVRFKLAEIFE